MSSCVSLFDRSRNRLLLWTLTWYSSAAALRSLVSQRRADHHHADPPGDPLVLDDEDLAALAVRAAAGGVVAAPGECAGRVHAEVAAFLDSGDVPQPLERCGDVG